MLSCLQPSNISFTKKQLVQSNLKNSSSIIIIIIIIIIILYIYILPHTSNIHVAYTHASVMLHMERYSVGQNRLHQRWMCWGGEAHLQPPRDTLLLYLYTKETKQKNQLPHSLWSQCVKFALKKFIYIYTKKNIPALRNANFRRTYFVDSVTQKIFMINK